MQELKHLRKLNEKHFLKEDGTIEAHIYQDKIHCYKNNEYVEIDNTLVLDNNRYHNKDNDLNVSFSKESDEGLLEINKDNHYLNFFIKDSNKVANKPLKKDDKKRRKGVIKYLNIFDNIDVDYQILPNKVKEEIIIHDKNNIKDKFIFEIKTDLKLVLNEDGSISSNTFKIEKPFMKDSNNLINNNIYYDLIDKNEGYELILNLDLNWLNSDIKYPVYIDPTITTQSMINMQDTYISSEYPTINFGNTANLNAYVDENGKIFRSLLKFDLPTIGTGDSIVSARLYLHEFPELYGPGTYTSRLVSLHRVTVNWNEATATWNNMSNKYDEKVEDFIGTDEEYYDWFVHQAGYVSFDITNLVKRWYGGTPNYGVLIKTYNEIYYANQIKPEYISCNHNLEDSDPKPFIVISYRNQNGLESYMSYREFSLTNCNLYANNYNGNITCTFDLGKTVNGKLPVSLSLIYNTNDVVLNNDYNVAMGYKFNLQQIIKKVIIEEEQMYQYIDEDGTSHYFIEEQDEEGNKLGTYIDEDGLSLKLELNDSEYVIKDKNNNKLVFTKFGDDYYLTKIIDVKNNEININYSSNKISKVIDANNNEITITYGNNITVVSPFKTSIIEISNNKITSITDNIGKINISYNNKNIIDSIVDVNNQKLKLDYFAVIPYRIKKISEYGKLNTIGKTYEFEYEFEKTNIKDNNGKVITYTFNNYGNTVCKTNIENSKNIKNSYGESCQYGDYINKNKLLDEKEMTKYIENLVWNSSFEKDNHGFTSDNLSVSLSLEHHLTGTKSLKLSGIGNSKKDFSLNTGTYTFSFYSKADNDYKVILSSNSSKELIVEASDEFIRNSITIDVIDNLEIEFKLLQNSIVYIDDIQLEKGNVANNYNLIDNSDFKYGLAGWEYNNKIYDINEDFVSIDIDGKYDEIITDNNGNNYLKLISSPLKSRAISRTIEIDGNEGDTYFLSFWYKNLGVKKEYNEFKNNTVQVILYPKDESIATDSVLFFADLNSNNDDWQFFSEVIYAGYDYNSLKLNIMLLNSANEFCITNFTLVKGFSSVTYQYDNLGNLIGIKDKNDNFSNLKYDDNNQLIKMSDPLGNDLKYEYDKYYTDRILTSISPSGITNKIVYDDFNNPIITKTSKNTQNELVTGTYYIRLSGTSKYLYVAPITKTLRFKDDFCSHDKFDVTINDNSIVINPALNDKAYLNNYTDISTMTFEFVKQDNDSYILRKEITQEDELAPKKYSYLTCSDDGLLLDDGPGQEFYFENVHNSIYIENNAEYSSDGRFLTKTIDTLFNETNYVTNDKGLITSMTDALGNITNYTYNNKDQLTKITKGEMEVDYEYDGTLLSKIIQDNKEYSFNYDEFLNTKSVYINNNKLIENNYEENNGNLLSSIYGNGHTINYTYDEFDRILNLNKMNNTYKYYYDNFGNIKRVDSNDNTYYYDYDFSQRLIGYEENNFKINYDYNELDNLVLEKQTLNDLSNTYLYEHNNEDNITKITNGNTVINYTYDELQRLKERNINNYITKYSYVTNGNRTSDLIDTIEENNDIYKYKYDKLGNIIKIIKNNNLINHYYYDQYNQLIKEENGNETITYEYDNFGNILNKKTYNNDILLTTDTYLYTNTNWKDQLTKYNDTSITYDAIGNPITIGNINLSWINGRQLNSYTDTTNNLNISYKYNKDGIRTEKNINGNITKYYVEGNKIIYLQTNGYVLYFIYENDALIGFKYAGNTYYYLKNIQDDILGILNSSFEQIVSYEYDSYGKIKSIKDGLDNIITDTNNIAYINPFRYRSYFYDDETGLYYLNSRYYNPTWGRFINADGILGANNDILSYNLYAYCSNNFINYSDVFGSGLFDLVLNFGKTLKKIYDTVKKYVAIEYTQTIYSDDTKLACPVNYGYHVTTTTTIGNKNAPFKITIKDKNEIGTKLDFSLVELGASVGDNGLSMNLGFNYDNKSYNLTGNIESISRVNLIVDYNVQTGNISTGNYISYGANPLYFTPFYYKKIGIVSNTNYFPSPIPIGAH